MVSSMHVIIIALVLAAYLLYFLYDLLNVTDPASVIGRGLFAVATALLVVATGLFIFRAFPYAGGIRTALFFPLAAASLAGLVISVFFSLPAGTYEEPGARRKTYMGGMYALCRHPGVLTYCLFYIFLYLTMPDFLGLIEVAVFCIADVLYMLFQDIWSFPKIFSDYEDYKRQTPMFFPTLGSIRRYADCRKRP